MYSPAARIKEPLVRPAGPPASSEPKGRPTMVAGNGTMLEASDGRVDRKSIMASPHVSRDCGPSPLRLLSDAKSSEIRPNRISSKRHHVGKKQINDKQCRRDR